jgi:predicted nucleic acid-binding protein
MLLVYAVDPENPAKQRVAADLLRAVARDATLVLSAQSLNEFYRVSTERRGLLDRKAARAEIRKLEEFCVAPYDIDAAHLAWRIQDEHRFSFWDCVLLASASIARCDVFLSEDLQHERRIGGMTILNPFLVNPDFQPTR